MKKYMLFATCLISTGFYAQKEDLAFFGGANFQEVDSKSKISADLTGRYYLQNRLSIGLQFLYNTKRYEEGFGYFTDRTVLTNMTINTIVQYDFLKNDQFIVAAFVGNGVNLVELRNLNEVRIEQYFDPETYLYYDVVTPRILEKNAIYVFTPGVDVSLKLATLGKSEKIGMYVTARAGYQFSFGENTFTGSNFSNNITGSFGITFKGTSQKVN